MKRLKRRTKTKRKDAPRAKVSTTSPGQRIPTKVIQANDPWSEYKLEDGTIIRVKHVIVDVNRIEGEYDSLGNPLYEIKAANLIESMPSDKFKRKTR